MLNINNIQFLNKNNPKKISNNINPNEICITIWEIMKRIVDFFNVDVIIRVDFNRDENEIDFNSYKLFKVKEFNFSNMNMLHSNVKKTYWFYGEFNVKGYKRFHISKDEENNHSFENEKLRINNNENNNNIVNNDNNNNNNDENNNENNNNNVNNENNNNNNVNKENNNNNNVNNYNNNNVNNDNNNNNNVNNNKENNENLINNINKNTSKKNNIITTNNNSFKKIFLFKDYGKLFLSPKGLINPSVYCYMNTAFQCLLSIPELNYHFSSSQYFSNSNKKNLSICDSFKDLIVSYNSQNTNTIYPPKTIYQSCSSLISLNYQQDSQEFLRRFLGGIQDELNHSKKYVFPENISMNVAWNIYRSNNNSFIDSIFSGLIRSQIKCFKCKKISNTFDPFLDLSLSVNNNKNKEKLNDCLSEYFKEEVIKDKDTICDKCKSKNIKMSKKLDIVILPPVLTIHIKRFEGNGDKINTKISFNLELDLEKFINNEKNNDIYNDNNFYMNKFLKYELFATVVHQGSSIRGGHYFAVVKRKDEWFICDDESVSKCNEKNALNSDCYLLFYRQIQN